MNPAPQPEVFDAGFLDVGDGHRVYYEQVGAPAGSPIVYLHGGPGAGCPPAARTNFDPARHRAVLFDQRAAGRSTPHASEPDVDWSTIDLDHHLADIERIREHLGIDRWVVFGVSWGSVLGVAYAQRHVKRVHGVVVGAVSTGTRADVDWLTVGMGRHRPDEWDAFRRHVPERLAGERLVEAYRRLVMDPDPEVHGPAAQAWCRWEDAHIGAATPDLRYDDARFRIGFARQVTHCWAHDHWLDDDELVANAHRLAGVRGRLIHGGGDVSSPLDGPRRLHEAWPGSRLEVIDEDGHGGPGMAAAWRRALVELA